MKTRPISPSFPEVFAQLRAMLQRHAANFAVGHDTAGHYTLEAPVGPAILRMWGGKGKDRVMPVAWVQSGKGYVSYHLMGVYGNPRLLEDCSEALMARMQGKSCFNFKVVDEPLFRELERLTKRSLAGMRKMGYIAAPQPTPSRRKPSPRGVAREVRAR